MKWKETVISALRKGNIDLALKTAAKADPEELFVLLESFPDYKDYIPYIAALLNKIGNLYWDAQMIFPAEKAFRKALKEYQGLSKENPMYIHDISVILGNLGKFYGQIEEFFEAEKALKMALNIIKNFERKNSVSYSSERALILNNLGALYLDRKKFSKAEEFLTRVLKIRKDLAEENPDVYNPDVAMTLNSLGALYCQIGKFQKAEKVHNESLQIRRMLAEKNSDYEPDVAKTLNNLGLFYKDTRKFSEAETVYKEALTIRRTLAKENPDYVLQVAMTLNNMGLLYRDTQKYSEAEKAFNEALDKYRKGARCLKAYISRIVNVLNNLGALYRIIGKFYEAESIFTEALKECELLEEENPDYTSLVAMTLNNFGLLYRDTKKFDKAKEALKKSLKKYRVLEKENPGAYTPDIAQTLNYMGAVLVDRKEFDGAEESYNEALEKYRYLARNNRAYLSEAAGVLNNLGLLYRKTQQFSKAEKVFTEALETFKGMGSWFDASSTCNNLSQIKSNGELEMSRIFLEMAVLFSEERKYVHAQKGEREYIYMELLKEGVDPFSVLEALRDPELLSLSWKQVVPRDELEKARKDVEFQKVLVEKSLHETVPSHQIPVNIPEGVLFVYIQEIEGDYLFFAVNREGTERFKGKKEFFTNGIKLLYLLRFQLRAVGKPQLTAYMEKFDELSREWYKTLPQDLVELIQGKDRIVFSPDYYCSFFPLEALHINGDSLCMEKTVVRAASLHQFLLFSKRNLRLDSSLIVGNPWPHCDKEELIYSLPSSSKQFKILSLHGAKEEARSLKKELPHGTILTGESATGKTFLSDISKHSLIHFCGHGSLGRILFLTGPLQGFPAPYEPEEFSDLRKAERVEGVRNINMMDEWYPVTDLDLFDVPLTEGAVIFLNACETGQHKYAGGGYYQGLPAVFLKNGAHSVVSSSVPIFDNSSKEFAIKFYESLLHTHLVSQSLKKARKWTRNRYGAQIYWLPYIHYGPPL